MKARLILMVVLLVVVATTNSFAQCAMCRGVVESTVSGGRSVVASNLNFGILYLLVIPYLLVSAIGLLWYRNSKKEYGRRLEISRHVKRALSSM